MARDLRADDRRTHDYLVDTFVVEGDPRMAATATCRAAPGVLFDIDNVRWTGGVHLR